jgi:flavin-dependent dehydrogenase
VNHRLAILGAGPAGSTLALALARSGAISPADIALIEAKAFPRVKVCGEYVSPAATHILESLLPPSHLLAAGARRVDRLVLEVDSDEFEWVTPVPAWTLSRAALDDRLLAAVADSGVTILQPARVGGVDYASDHVRIRLADGRTIHAHALVHADGSGRHDPAGPTPVRRGVVGLKCHFRPPSPVVGVRMRSVPGAYIGTIQVEGGLATCALTCDARLIAKAGGDADAMLAALWPRWDAARRTTDWQSCGVAASGYIRPGHPRSLRIGNAAAGIEPVGGEGIGMALWAGLTLADLLASHGLDDLPRVERALARAYRSRLRVRRPACRIAAAALARPRLVRLARPLLRLPRLSLAPWFRLTGKPAGPQTP